VKNKTAERITSSEFTKGPPVEISDFQQQKCMTRCSFKTQEKMGVSHGTEVLCRRRGKAVVKHYFVVLGDRSRQNATRYYYNPDDEGSIARAHTAARMEDGATTILPVEKNVFRDVYRMFSPHPRRILPVSK
jgi:hypothetical protein